MFNRSELFDEGDLDAAIARFDHSAGRRRDWKTRQAKWTSVSLRNSRPGTGMAWQTPGRRHLAMTITVEW